MTGIITAMKCEADAIEARLTDVKKEKVGYGTFICGRLGSTDVVLSVCGVGKVFAGVCANIMIVNFKCSHLYNIGVAGALTQDLEIGDTVSADATVQYDMDTSAVGDPVGLISGINVIQLPCDGDFTKEFEEFCAAKGRTVKTGIIATGDKFFKGEDQRRPVAERFGACVGEMEGAAVGQICYANGIPYNVVRVITDKASDSVGDQYAQNLEACAVDLAQTFADFMENKNPQA